MKALMESSKSYNVIPYNIKLDTLRAIAVILVIISHWIPSNRIISFFPLGMMGVTLFFVLSGYLITSILLQLREAYLTQENSTRNGLLFFVKLFYYRRILRIFPIYYILLLILIFFGNSYLKENYSWYLSYTQNVLIHKTNQWPDSFSHLWSLAVEEQFYIIWPWLVLLIPKRHFVSVIWSVILIGLISIFLLDFVLFPRNSMNNVLLLPTFASFGLGALLSHYKFCNLDIFEKKIAVLLTIFFSVFFIIMCTFNITPTFKTFIFSCLSFLFVGFLLQKRNFYVEKVFSLKLVVFIGKISYGLYLYHNFVLMFYNKFLSVSTNIKVGFLTIPSFPNLNNPFSRLVIMTIVLLLVSLISWFLIEKPIASLKKYVKYSI